MPRPVPFEIKSFSSASFYAAIKNQYCVIADLKRKQVAQYIVEYLEKLETKTIIIEHNYTDGDYLDDFAAYYVRCFSTYERRCKRIHFFSRTIEEDKFKLIIQGKLSDQETERFKSSYLGFVVARPLPDAVIGRTILSTYPSDNGRRHYTAIKTYTANLFGIPLQVQSLAYQEQDTVLAACATVALWSCFHKTSELFSSSSFTPAEITRAGNQIIHNVRPIPSHGLNVQQMCNVIRQVGLEPEVLHITKRAENVPIVSLIYGHLHMGLPVVLGVEIAGRGMHAVTLTGYSLCKSKKLMKEVAPEENSIPMTGLRIDKFYAHDDQIGPFACLEIIPSEELEGIKYPVLFQRTWKDETTGSKLILYPKVIVIPIYHKIRVTFTDIIKWLTRVHSLVESLFPDPPDLEWDVHLTTTNEYKSIIKQEGRITGLRLDGILLQQHPRFIWRATLSIENRPVVELLSDATDMSRSFPFYQIAWFNNELEAKIYKYIHAEGTEQDCIRILKQKLWMWLKESFNS